MTVCFSPPVISSEVEKSPKKSVVSSVAMKGR